MTTEVATVEPREVVAGDTWEWEKSFSDYPATTWTLTYYLRSREHEASITAAADGTDHLVTVAKATTAAYKAGLYEITGFVTDATERFQVYRGLLNVLPDPASQGAGQDPRSHARKTLDAIEAVVEGRATKDQQAYTIGGRSLQRMPIKDLMYFRGVYRAEVYAEESRLTGRGSKVVTRL
jgi:hypothetical protein